jgi:hypothetical protein
MSRHGRACGFLATLMAGSLAAAIGMGACSSDETPTGSPADPPVASITGAANTFGPFPGRATVFVDVDNRTGVEDGTRAHPFSTLSKALGAARSGDAVGLAPGVYAETFPQFNPNYVIQGRRTFKLLGMGPGKTTLRGDHSATLIQVRNGASGLIEGMTIERGGHPNSSEGGGVQVLGITDSASVTINNVILQDNWAVNGGAISAEGRVTLRLTNVLAANNVGTNCCGGILLAGLGGRTRATFKNVTVTSNAANFHTGGVLLEHDARLTLVNSIVWNNDLAEIGRYVGTEVIGATYSDVGEMLLPGLGNISADPLFQDPGSRDFRLRPRSPTVDAGTNSGAPLTDIRGLTRPVDGNGDGKAVTDMGAYEFGKVAPAP